ncbi:MAG TPA: outer membrane beta-barrel protein [Puia sp.]|jgi:hypothetical protein|nr:outer membrane beta-barrel protein [Puia sp.]
MKKQLLIVAILFFSISAVSAQSNSNQSFVISAGVNLGLPAGDFHDGYSFGAGVELQGEYMFSDQFSGVGSVGYTEFFGKTETATIGGQTFSAKAPNVGLIPILAGARFYPSTNFFVGAKIGYGIFTNTGSSSGNSGFDYCPQIGYNADMFQLVLSYNSVSITGETLSHLGLSLIFKLNSGK